MSTAENPQKVALITGAGSGFGRATAVLFAHEGARVVVVDVDPETGQQTVDMIVEAGNKAVFAQADVSQAPDVERMISFTKNTYGRLDILYNNAGIPMANTPIEDVDEEIWDRILENVWRTRPSLLPAGLAREIK